MVGRDIKTYIIRQLSELPVYYPSDDNIEHNIRCPYCGDSQKDESHAHLWIKIDPSTNESMPWLCFRCGMSGRVTTDFLEDLDIHVSEKELKELKAYNRKADKVGRKTIVRIEQYKVPQVTPNYFTDVKLDYLNRRLGLQFGYAETQSNKIVLSIEQFMAYNSLSQIKGVEDWQLQLLERDYIGFLSSNNNMIVFRNIASDKYRYRKILLNPYNNDDACFYSIPTSIPLLYDGPLHVHIAEGTFDALSIRYNVVQSTENAVFYASCGYRYLSIIKYLARAGLCTDITLNVYADKDKSDYDHMKLLGSNPVTSFLNHVIIHRNHYPGEKDYGVPLSSIDDKFRKLW